MFHKMRIGDSIVVKAEEADHWFDKISPKQQQDYCELHPDSDICKKMKLKKPERKTERLSDKVDLTKPAGKSLIGDEEKPDKALKPNKVAKKPAKEKTAPQKPQPPKDYSKAPIQDSLEALKDSPILKKDKNLSYLLDVAEGIKDPKFWETEPGKEMHEEISKRAQENEKLKKPDTKEDEDKYGKKRKKTNEEKYAVDRDLFDPADYGYEPLDNSIFNKFMNYLHDELKKHQ